MTGTIGQRIARRRNEIPRFRRSQQRLADEVGVKRGQVSLWENDKQKPSGENLVALAKALSVISEWILHGDNGAGPVIRERGADYIGIDIRDLIPTPPEGEAWKPGDSARVLIDWCENLDAMRRFQGGAENILIGPAADVLRRLWRSLDRWSELDEAEWRGYTRGAKWHDQADEP